MNYFEELGQVIARLDVRPIYAFVAACEGTLWLCGNGGSAAIAQHWACDLTKAAGRRTAVLGGNLALLTAHANDHSYESALADELQRMSQPFDRLLCLSCSGQSENIITALREAWLLKLPRALITGNGWAGITPVDLEVNVPHAHYGIIEDCFQAIGHAITEALCSR